jgi:HSP20 family molecular chaperone IbpA
MDFYIFPESDLGKKIGLNDLQDNKNKGIKISYHFEPGMDEPEVKIESDIDKDKIKEYLKGLNSKNHSNLRKFMKTPSKSNKKYIDAEQLSLDNSKKKKEREPLTEVHDYANYTEIILEVPGIREEDVEIEITNDGKTFEFSAENENSRYVKMLPLTFRIRDPDYSINVNNGIAIIKIK